MGANPPTLNQFYNNFVIFLEESKSDYIHTSFNFGINNPFICFASSWCLKGFPVMKSTLHSTSPAGLRSSAQPVILHLKLNLVYLQLMCKLADFYSDSISTGFEVYLWIPSALLRKSDAFALSFFIWVL